MLLPLLVGLFLALLAGGGGYWTVTSGPLAPEVAPEAPPTAEDTGVAETQVMAPSERRFRPSRSGHHHAGAGGCRPAPLMFTAYLGGASDPRGRSHAPASARPRRPQRLSPRHRADRAQRSEQASRCSVPRCCGRIPDRHRSRAGAGPARHAIRGELNVHPHELCRRSSSRDRQSRRGRLLHGAVAATERGLGSFRQGYRQCDRGSCPHRSTR